MDGWIDGWMECLGGDVNRMVCRMGLCGVDWIGLGLGCDWAIVCGVCYYPKLLQMQQIHPKPRPRLVITNSADNTRY